MVLTGAGERAFSSGYDLSAEAAHSEIPAHTWHDVLATDIDATMRVWALPKPTIAAVHGYCLAGGCELAMACDMIITGESGRFGEPEIRYGSGPVTLLMPFILGQKKTNELLFTGDMIDAGAAERAGLVNRVVPDDQVEAEVEGLVRKIAPTPLPVLRLTKIALVRAYEAMGLQGSCQYESRPVLDAERGGYTGAERVHGHRQVTRPEGRPRMARRALRRDPGRCESMSVAESTIDPTRLARLIETEEAEFNDRHKESRAMTERAGRVLAGGVASSWQATEPHPIYLADGHGSKVVDVDGNEYVDFHNGYGAMAVGHAHPKIAEIVSERVRRGTHFAQPTEDSVVVGEHLSAALRPAALAVRQLRHRVHDGRRPADAGGDRARHPAQDRGLLPRPRRRGHGVGGAPGATRSATTRTRTPCRRRSGFPDAVVELTRVVPFNDLDALERTLHRYQGQVAGHDRRAGR